LCNMGSRRVAQWYRPSSRRRLGYLRNQEVTLNVTLFGSALARKFQQPEYYVRWKAACCIKENETNSHKIVMDRRKTNIRTILDHSKLCTNISSRIEQNNKSASWSAPLRGFSILFQVPAQCPKQRSYFGRLLHGRYWTCPSVKL